MSSLKYRPEIDGLRTVAVIPVLLFHLGANWMRGGFIGVDVFFVISGYLITSIIVKDFQRGTFKFQHFWQRRMRRILPVLLTVVAATSLGGYFTLYGLEINNLGKQGLATLFSLSNINFWSSAGDYWGTLAQSSPLLHTWSLSVEEQFYLFLPLLVIGLLKFKPKLLVPVVALLTLGSVIVFVYGSFNYPSATFYLLPTRIWELGSGSLIALLSSQQHFKFQNNSFLSLVGLLMILASYVLITGEGGVSAYMIFPIIGTILIVIFAKDKSSLTNRMLAARPMVYIGKISYSLYLWHWPVLVLSKSYFLSHNIHVPDYYLLPLMFLLAIASYYLVEQTTRRNATILPYIILFFGLTAGYLSILYKADFSEDITAYNQTLWEGKLYNVSPKQEWTEAAERKMAGIIVPTPATATQNLYAEGGVIKKYGGESPELVVLGDSHALMWSGVLDEIASELGTTVSFYAADGTPTFFSIPIDEKQRTLFFTPEEKVVFDQMRLDYLKQWQPEVVVISTRWANLADIQVTQDLITAIGEIGSQIVLIEQPPELFFGDKNTPRYLSFLNMQPIGANNRYIDNAENAAYQAGKAMVRQIANNCDYCEFVPVADIYTHSQNDQVWVLDGSDVLYIDDDHLSYAGATKAKDRLLQTIRPYFTNNDS